MLGQTSSYKRRKLGGFVTKEILQLNHYYLRSKTETENKIRGSAVSGADPDQREAVIRRKARLIESDTIEDRAAITFLERHHISSSEELRCLFGGEDEPPSGVT